MPALTLATLVEHIRPGNRLAIPADYGGVAMAATIELLRQGTGGLHLVCVPTSGLQADLLIGNGQVHTLESSAISLGEAGPAPQFTAAVRAGRLRLLDATCPAIMTGLLAAQKGVPFIPMRGLIGTDLLRHRTDWQLIDNPFAAPGRAPDPIVLIPAIHPDVALFHAPLADLEGNVWIGRRRELAAMAYAATTTLVTVESISETSLLASETMAAGVLPALYVSAVAVAPRGAAPYGLWGHYAADIEALGDYARRAQDGLGFRAHLETLLQHGEQGAPA